LELHLIKGKPAVHKGDNLIVSHISLETDNIQEVLTQLQRLGVSYSRNVSVPTGDESAIVTQYFIRDPDGYYIELCNCDILTKFCLSLDDDKQIAYNENVEKVNPTSIVKLALVANALNHSKRSRALEDLVLPKDQWGAAPDPIKLQNLLKRTKIYADPMQGETEEKLSRALIEANNCVPRATRIIIARKGGKVTMIPPGFFVKGQLEKYQPAAILLEEKILKTINEEKKDVPSLEKSPSFKISSPSLLRQDSTYFKRSAKELIKQSDFDGSGTLSIDELKILLRSICVGISDTALDQMIDLVDKNHDGTISIEEIVGLMSTQESEMQILAFFNLLDDDKNGKITLPEFSKALSLIGVDITDEQVEEIFIQSDLDGDGTMDALELEKLLKGFSDKY